MVQRQFYQPLTDQATPGGKRFTSPVLVLLLASDLGSHAVKALGLVIRVAALAVAGVVAAFLLIIVFTILFGGGLGDHF